jgi:hypothetical protein
LATLLEGEQQDYQAVRRTFKQRLQVVKKLLGTDYPLIASRTKKEEKTEIHWGDETGVQTGANRVRDFSSKGEKPVINLVTKKVHVGIISALLTRVKRGL